MTPPLPLPVRVAAGLVATAVEQARDLPRLALELPVTAVSQALQASMRVQQKVTELAIKGDQVLGVGPPIEDEPAWATFDEDLPPRRNGRSTGAAAPAATVHAPALQLPTRSSSRARVDPGSVDPEPVPDRRRRRGAVRNHGRRTGRPARLRLADHPPAARQAAPPRRGRPARAAGLGAGARRPAAVRDDAEQPDRGGHRGVSERSERAGRHEHRRGHFLPGTRALPATGSECVTEPSPNSADAPWPVRTVARKIAAWVDRLGAVWVEGQLAQVTARPGTGTAFLVLRDPAADVSLQLTAPDRAGPRRRCGGRRGQPGGGARQAVVLPRARHAEPARRHDPRRRDRRAAGPHRAAARAAGRRGAVRRRPQAAAAVPARLHRA